MANSEENTARAETVPKRPWASLPIRDYGLFGSPAFNTVAIQIRNVSRLYQVYQISGSAIKLGLTGFLETLPFVIFGLFAGAVANDSIAKKCSLPPCRCNWSRAVLALLT